MDLIILVLSVYLLLKEKIAWVLFFLIMLTTRYLGAGSAISQFVVEHNVYDTGLLLYFLLVIFILHKAEGSLPKVPNSGYLILFYLFLVTSILIDLTANQMDFVSVIKTSRHWLFLSCIWIFAYIPPAEIDKLMKYLLYATVVVSLIFLIEFLFGIQITGMRKPEEVTSSGDILVRGSIPTSFALFFTLLLLTDYFKFSTRLKYFLIVVITSTAVFSMIRSAIAEWAVGILLLFILKERMKLKNILLGAFSGLVLTFIVFSNQSIKDRFISGIEEIRTFNIMNTEVQGNFTFRIFHAQERIRYVSQSLQYVFFGIGNITEENFPETFAIGLVNEEGKTSQLDTGDIAWSLLLIRLGFAGTLIYLIFYIKIMLHIFRFRFQNQLAVVLFIYLLIYVTIGTITSSSIAKGLFWIFPLLLYNYLQQIEYEQHGHAGLDSDSFLQPG